MCVPCLLVRGGRQGCDTWGRGTRTDFSCRIPTTASALLAGGTSEHEKLCRARDQCREILKFVNEAVRHAENRHRVEGYQKRLDTTSLDRASNPLAAEFKVGARGAPGNSAGQGPERGRGRGPSVRTALQNWACTRPGGARSACPQGDAAGSPPGKTHMRAGVAL